MSALEERNQDELRFPNLPAGRREGVGRRGECQRPPPLHRAAQEGTETRAAAFAALLVVCTPSASCTSLVVSSIYLEIGMSQEAADALGSPGLSASSLGDTCPGEASVSATMKWGAALRQCQCGGASAWGVGTWLFCCTSVLLRLHEASTFYLVPSYFWVYRTSPTIWGGNMQISVTVTSGRYSMKKAELGFTWSMRFQTVCLGVLGSWLRSHHSGGGEPPGQGSDPSLPSFRQNKFPSRTLYLSYILGTPRGCF